MDATSTGRGLTAKRAFSRSRHGERKPPIRAPRDSLNEQDWLACWLEPKRSTPAAASKRRPGQRAAGRRVRRPSLPARFSVVTRACSPISAIRPRATRQLRRIRQPGLRSPPGAKSARSTPTTAGYTTMATAAELRLQDAQDGRLLGPPRQHPRTLPDADTIHLRTWGTKVSTISARRAVP